MKRRETVESIRQAEKKTSHGLRDSRLYKANDFFDVAHLPINLNKNNRKMIEEITKRGIRK